MKKAVLCAWLLTAKAQVLWIERAAESHEPPLQAQLYRLQEQEWVLVLKINLTAWLPYGFDSSVPVRAELIDEAGLLAETLFTLPLQPYWQGSWRWPLQRSPRSTWVGLQISCPEAPQEPYFTRIASAGKPVGFWIESPSSLLTLPVEVKHPDGTAEKLSPDQGRWNAYFVPAQVDTSLPLPPYLLRRKKKPVLVCGPCAWQLRGDTTRVFWTCRWPGSPYPSPGGTLPAPSPQQWESAFQRFSDRKPGDRSDRGLIFLYVGAPPLRLLTLSSEVWVYPERQLSFHFVYEEGTWRLVRKLEYQRLWKKR